MSSDLFGTRDGQARAPSDDGTERRRTSAPRIDVTAWIGDYPYRAVPHPTPDVLVRVLDREGFSGAWVGHLPGAFHRDPVPSNRELFKALRPYRDVLHPAPIVRPDWPGWERQLREAREEGAPAVRIYPAQWSLAPQHQLVTEFVDACAAGGTVLHVTLRFEDLRQRHPFDAAPDVSAATLRALARRANGRGRAVMVVAGASRELIEETHWGLTPQEQVGVYYDFHWVWGPPEEHFAHLLRTVGVERLAWSSWWPLRLSQQAQALVDLLPPEEGLLVSQAGLAEGARISAFAREREAR